MRKYFSEFFGTFWLVFGGCGSALFSAAIPELGIGYAGVALAFGLTVLTMAYTVGPISGGHFNPAVTLGLVAGGRFNASQAVPYILSQIIGGIAAATILYGILQGQANGYTINNTQAGAFAANGYGELSPNKFDMCAAFITEFTLTAFFIFIIMGSTAKVANTKFAGIAIGLSLTLIHLVSIPITNTSVNPARSTSQAIFAGGEYISQLWLFWVAPIGGAILGGLVYKYLINNETK